MEALTILRRPARPTIDDDEAMTDDTIKVDMSTATPIRQRHCIALHTVA